MGKTTIQISFETLERLRNLKYFEKEPYDLVLNKLIDDYEEEFLSPEEIESIKMSLENVKKGKIKPIEQVAKELGISLD